jgi:integrase
MFPVAFPCSHFGGALGVPRPIDGFGNMRARITKRLIDGLKPTGTDYYVFDADTIGFAVRVRATGGMSYIVQYKTGSGRGAPARRVTLGGVGKMTPEQARTAARKVLGSVAHGADPAADKANERRALPPGDVIEAFLAEHAEAKRKASTAAWYRGGLQRIVKPAFGGMNPGKVTRQDVARLHSSLRDTPVQANRVLAMIGALYGFAARAGYVPEEYNPARGIEKFPERSRERFLTSEELARLGDTLRLGETTGLPWQVDETKENAKHAPKEDSRRVILDPFAVAAIRLLILTGARLREILHARWELIDFERGGAKNRQRRVAAGKRQICLLERLSNGALPRKSQVRARSFICGPRNLWCRGRKGKACPLHLRYRIRTAAERIYARL